MAENNFKQILTQVRFAGLKVFQYRQYKEVFREVVDLVFLCDATGGMENNGVFDQVSFFGKVSFYLLSTKKMLSL